MKPMTKIVTHSVIVLLMDGIIVKIIYSPFAGDPLEPPEGPLGHRLSIESPFGFSWGMSINRTSITTLHDNSDSCGFMFIISLTCSDRSDRSLNCLAFTQHQ